MPEGHFPPAAAPEPFETPTPLQVAPQSVPGPDPAQPPHPAHAAPVVQPSLVAAAGDQCPSCGAHMAIDQRYCLECGHRRGDPRLPFMDAVVFMDSVKQPAGGAASTPPPPPPEKRSRMTANASLIAGVATLVLAIGVGVMIGRSGEGNSSSANNTPQVIRVEGGGGGGEAETTPTETSKESGSEKSSKPGKATKSTAKTKSETGSSGTSKATEEVFKPKSGVKLAPEKVQKGGACTEGTVGCENGKFEGNFFE